MRERGKVLRVNSYIILKGLDLFFLSVETLSFLFRDDIEFYIENMDSSVATYKKQHLHEFYLVTPFQ